MRHYYEKPDIYFAKYGERYVCDHPVYNCCTLFRIGNKGLAVIQQRFDKKEKTTFWSDIDPWLQDELYLHPRFKEYFDEHSDLCKDGVYPTVTIRQIMWGLKMKPLPKDVWETAFERREI